jgi:hypothetical protein
MNVEIQIGFVTDINELMRRKRQQRIAIRREAWAELSVAVHDSVAAAARHSFRVLAPSRSGVAAAV